MFGVTIPGGYRATTSLDVEFKNLRGGPADYKTIKYESKQCNSIQEAVNNADKEIGYKITNLLYDAFPLKVYVTDIVDTRKNGAAKKVTIKGGSSIGVFKKGELRVYDAANPDEAGGNVIGRLKVGDVSSDSAECEVKEGGEKIAELLTQGKKLRATLP